MDATLVADIEGLTWMLLLLRIKRILHGCYSSCGYRGSYMYATLVADIEGPTWMLLLLRV